MCCRSSVTEELPAVDETAVEICAVRELAVSAFLPAHPGLRSDGRSLVSVRPRSGEAQLVELCGLLQPGTPPALGPVGLYCCRDPPGKVSPSVFP